MSKKIYNSEDIKRAVNKFCADEEWNGSIFNHRRVSIEMLSNDILQKSEGEDFSFRPYELKAFGLDANKSYNLLFNVNNSHFVLTNEPLEEVIDYSENWQQLLSEKSNQNEEEIER